MKIINDRLNKATIKSMLAEARWIYGYAKGYWGTIIFYISIGVLGILMALGASVASKDLINAVTSRDSRVLLGAAALFVGMSVVRAIVNAITSRISAKLDLSVNNEIRADVFDKIILADWESMAKYHSGDILNRLNSDVSSVAQSILGFIPGLITGALKFVMTFGLIFYHDPVMACIAMIGIPISIIASRYMLGKVRKYSIEQRTAASAMMSFNEETLSNIQAVKSFNLVDMFCKKLRIVQGSYIAVALKTNKFSVWSSFLLTMVGLAVSCSCYGWGIYRLWTGYYEIGTMFMFLQLASFFSSSFSSLIGLVPMAVGATASAGRLMELLNIPRENISVPQAVSTMLESESEVSIEVVDISFAYKGGGEVFSLASMSAKARGITAIVGPSGKGKTTLLRLLLGLAIPGCGSIKAAAGSVHVDISPQSRRLFSYVAQDNMLFTGSIAQNLRMVCPDADDDALRAALEMSCAMEFVEALPDGINTMVGEKGAGLSEGQIQRITIARALLTRAPVLLMDEATSALDVATERRILRNIQRAAAARTIIVTTHRPTVLDICSAVYRIEDKKLIRMSRSEIESFIADF